MLARNQLFHALHEYKVTRIYNATHLVLGLRCHIKSDPRGYNILSIHRYYTYCAPPRVYPLSYHKGLPEL